MKNVVNLVLAVCLALSVCPASHSQAVAEMAQAKSDTKVAIKLYNGRQYLKAAKAFSKNIKDKYGQKDPKNYYYLGNCYYQLGRAAHAKHMYNSVVSKFPNSAEAKSSRQMLARVSPGSARKASPRSGSSRSAYASSRSSASRSSSRSGGNSYQRAVMAMDQELSRLPNENRFFFDQGRSGHMEVDVYLNGRKIRAWFDTGANAHFGINHLRAAGITDIPRGKPNGATSGWSQNRVAVWRQPIKLRIGNIERTVPVSIEKHMNLMPLVGQGFVRGYEYEIVNSGPRHFVSMKKKSSSSSGSIYKNIGSSRTNDLYDVPCQSRGMRDFVTMQVNGKRVQVLLDTGSDATILALSTARKLGIRIPANARTVTASGVGGSLAYKVVPCDIKLGPIYARGYPIQIGATGGMCAVGQDLLRRKRYRIDREKKLLRFFH